MSKTLQKFLDKCDEVYYGSGTSLISDAEYDTLQSQVDNGDEPNIRSSEVMKRSKETHILPFYAASLNKAMLDENKKELPSRLRSFIKLADSVPLSENVASKLKLDGVSAIFNAGKLYTQGDRGVEGFDISWMLDYLSLESREMFEEEEFPPDLIFRGELILTKSDFKTHFSKKYSNARNLVSGVVNSISIDDNAKEICGFIHYVIFDAYTDGASFHAGGTRIRPRVFTFEGTDMLCQNFGFEYVGHDSIPIDSLSDFDTLHTLAQAPLSNEVYECDGLVLCLPPSPEDGSPGAVFPHNPLLDSSLSKSEKENAIVELKNPKTSIAIKIQASEGGKIVEVREVRWQISAFGKLKPVIHFNEIDIEGVKIVKCTGKNAGWIWKNKIGEGAFVRIDRSGGVIPNVVDVIQGCEESMLIETFPYPTISLGAAKTTNATNTAWSGSKSLDFNGEEVGVELVIVNEDVSSSSVSNKGYSEIDVKKAARFWTKLDADGVKQKSLENMIFKNGFNLKTILDVCIENVEREDVDFTSWELYQVLKVKGEKAASNFLTGCYTSFKKVVDNQDLAVMLTAFPYTPEGLGLRTFRLLDSEVGLKKILSGEVEVVDIKVKGIGPKTKTNLVKCIEGWNRWCNEIEGLRECFEREEMSREGAGPSSSTDNTTPTSTKLVYCFTGCRDKALKARLESEGHTISTSLTKKVNVLVVKDTSDKVMSSAKAKKALKMGIEIRELKSFEKV